jgi:hypothetical protein
VIKTPREIRDRAQALPRSGVGRASIASDTTSEDR